MSGSNCSFLTHKQVSPGTGKVVWYSHLCKTFPQFVVIHVVKGFSVVNEAEVDVFLELSCFLSDATNVGSPVISKSSLYIWKFSVHVLMKPSLKDFEHYLASMWNECKCTVVRTFFGMPFFGIGMKTDFFQSCGHCWVFQLCCHIECSTLTASPYRILNSPAEILWPPLALFVGMLPKEFKLCFLEEKLWQT